MSEGAGLRPDGVVDLIDVGQDDPHDLGRNRAALVIRHGAGEAAISCSGGFELERIKDMVSELEAIFQSHGRRAMRRLGR